MSSIGKKLGHVSTRILGFTVELIGTSKADGKVEVLASKRAKTGEELDFVYNHETHEDFKFNWIPDGKQDGRIK